MVKRASGAMATLVAAGCYGSVSASLLRANWTYPPGALAEGSVRLSPAAMRDTDHTQDRTLACPERVLGLAGVL